MLRWFPKLVTGEFLPEEMHHMIVEAAYPHHYPPLLFPEGDLKKGFEQGERMVAEEGDGERLVWP